MLKIRLIGTKNELTWFRKILERHNRIIIGEDGFSELKDLEKGPVGKYRMYVKIGKANLKCDKR